MKIPFRQGIIRYQRDDVGNQTFLQRAATGNAINLMAGTDPTIVTIAQRRNNYLVEERASVMNAWTGFEAGTDYWLFIDIDIVTGARTFGSTELSPTFGLVAPSNPAVDQHWFDTNSLVMCMKVFNGMVFVEKLRVFVAKYQQGAIIVPLSLGSQIARTESVDAGAILFDSDGNPIRKMFSRTQNEFFTTASIFTSNTAKAINVTMDALCTTVSAAEPIPAFSLVCHGTAGKIQLADSSTHGKVAIGMVQEDFYADESGIYTAQGYIYNEAWNWTVAPGTPLFLGNAGEVVVTPSQYHTIQNIGEVVSSTTIRLNLSPSLQYDSVTTDYANLVPISLDKTTGKYVVTTVDVEEEAATTRNGYLHIADQETNVWEIKHNRGSFKFVVQVFNTDSEVIGAEKIQTVDSNTIRVEFTAPQAGHACVVFFNSDIIQENYDISLSAISTFNSDETLLIQPVPINAILKTTAEGCRAVAKISDNAELYIKLDGVVVGTIVFTSDSNTGTFIIPQDVVINQYQVLEVTASPTVSALASVGALIRLQNTGTL